MANAVLDNLIGVQADALRAMPNGGPSVHVKENASDNTIGGTEAGEANVFHSNDSDGIFIESGRANSISGNSIFANRGLGIDLGTDDLTLNDNGDGDAGSNDLQNFPKLSAASLDNRLQIEGTMSGRPNTAYTLEFFFSILGDPSGHGGQTFLAQREVVTDGDGEVRFLFRLPLTVTVNVNDFITVLEAPTPSTDGPAATCSRVINSIIRYNNKEASGGREPLLASTNRGLTPPARLGF